MRHAPISEFTSKAAEYVASADAGEEIILTRDGQEILRKPGPTTAEESPEMINEGRR